jgi:hypothetical protein
MEQRKSALPIEALPVAPRQVLPISPGPSLVPLQALPVTPLSTREEALTEALTEARGQLREAREQLGDANDMGRGVLQYRQHEQADRTGRARRAGSAPKTKIAGKHAEMVEHWAATMDYQMEHGGRTEKGYIDRLVAERFQVHYKTVERARMKAGYK